MAHMGLSLLGCHATSSILLLTWTMLNLLTVILLYHPFLIITPKPPGAFHHYHTSLNSIFISFHVSVPNPLSSLTSTSPPIPLHV
ncbi:hypothetical protein PAXRUDRAFT_833221, partial [Paxillus rubicundulus Ve08.2h10]